ncbi:MAG: hypothetical protein Q9204_000879 [Flavoplaca sp. TL-2023a]
MPLYLIASVVMSFGGSFNGLDTGIIGPVSDMEFFRADIATTSAILHGLVVSSVLLPSAIVSVFAGSLADAVGRPRAVTIGFCVSGFGAAIEAGSIHIAMFIVGRIIIGIGIGLYLSTVVVYICELAPPAKRGVLTTMVQLFAAIGILTGYFICYGTVYISSSLSWRLPLAIQSFLAFLFAAVCVPLPQSPRWLTLCGRHDESRLLWIRLGVSLDGEGAEVSDEVFSDQREDTESKKDDQPSVPPAVVLQTPDHTQLEDSTTVLSHSIMRAFRKDVRSRTALAVYYLGMQQLCGIDSILYYAPIIFQQAGITSQKSSFIASGVTAIVIVVVTIPATLKADSWSRRMQTILGGCLISGCLFLIGILYASNAVHQTSGSARWVVIVTIYAYVISFCVTWGINYKSYPSEIQPPATRATATSLAQSANWAVNFCVVLVVPIFFASSESGPYFLFGGLTILNTAILFFIMPETRGRTLEDIHADFLHKIPHARLGRRSINDEHVV